VLVIRPAFQADEAAPVRAPRTRAAAERPAAATAEPKPRPAAASEREVYVIQSGDTLASVAAARGTTVNAIVELNPGIDPVGLQVGQRIRLK
jgi:LysM repeat protein